jgi:hypothetical protein
MRTGLLITCFVIAAISGCGGAPKALTTYSRAAKSLTTGMCGQRCWSQTQAELKEASCSNEKASAPLLECAHQLRGEGHFLVTEGKAQEQLRTCMRGKGWWLVYAFIAICE